MEALLHTEYMALARKALVIGGGIIGVTSAYTLARDGWQVRLIERESDVARGASFGNGRQLSYSHTNALANPHMLPQIPRLLMGCDEAFRLSLRPDLSFIAWSLRLLCNSTPAAYRKNTLETLALANRSRDAMERLLSRHAIEFDQRKVGKLVLLRGDHEVRAARVSMEMKKRAGLKQVLLDAHAACDVEPALAQTAEPIAAALFAPEDETGDCQAFARELCTLTQVEHGLQLTTAATAQSIDRGRDETRISLSNGEEIASDLVVVANGHDANRLLKPLGHHLPIEPMKGYSFTAPLGNAPPHVSITDSKRRIVFTNIGDRMLVAGIAEIGALDLYVDPARLASIKCAARATLPEAAIYSESDEGWAGYRPLTPNSQPITRLIEPGIAVNSGHGMLGWTLAMGSAERLSEIAAST